VSGAGPHPASASPGAASSATGNIYDLGYRRYEGPRLGRRHAIAALFSNSLRACFGVGRGGRAKIVPIGLAALALLPAIVSLGITGFARRFGGGELSLITYGTYYGLVAQLLFLFVAAQAPELLGRDLRHGVLALYFSRVLGRIDYAVAKLAALVVALLLIQLLPQLLIFVGRTLASTDLVGAASADAGNLPPVIAQAALASVLLAALALAIASFATRRAYATAGIIAAFIIPPIVAAVVDRFSGDGLGSRLVLLSPPDVLDGSNAWFFGVARQSPIGAAVPDVQFAIAGIVIALVAVAVLIRRYQKVAA
jgi:ABC-2 type transport system permease protein